MEKLKHDPGSVEIQTIMPRLVNQLLPLDFDMATAVESISKTFADVMKNLLGLKSYNLGKITYKYTHALLQKTWECKMI